jgi:3-hydroxyisobutyrate dehydrogenase-like beta-hydroxyacid dehydrogenase
MHIAFFGLGNMGNPMAANLLKSGRYTVSVFDLDKAKGENLITAGGQWIDDIPATLATADIIMTSLPGPVQIAAFAEGSVIPNAKTGSTWIDLSTNNLATCHALVAATTERGIGFLDSPVSGGDEGARAGTLSIYVGGDKALFDEHQAIYDAIGKKITHLGQSGAGYAAKISQVVLCYLHSIALSEALMLGVKAGVPAAEMLNIIQNSTGRSYVADRYGPCMLNGDYDPSFALGLALKDMRLAMELADTLGIELPMSSLVTEIYAKACDHHGKDANHLIAVRLLEEASGTYFQA